MKHIRELRRLTAVFMAVLLLLTALPISFASSCPLHDDGAHHYGNWVTEKKPTCSEEGVRYRTCACGAKERIRTQKTEHEWSEWEIVTEAAEGQSGEKSRTCLVCGTTETTAYELEGGVKKGDRKTPGVYFVQEMLALGGYEAGKTDGVYGEKTEQAVRDFQKDHGLAETGIAYPSTLTALAGEYIRKNDPDIGRTVALSSGLKLVIEPEKVVTPLADGRHHLVTVYRASLKASFKKDTIRIDIPGEEKTFCTCYTEACRFENGVCALCGQAEGEAALPSQDAETKAAPYTVTFVSSDGSSVTLSTDEEGRIASFPEETAEEGKSFAGWFTAPEGGEKVTEGTTFTADATVYAVSAPERLGMDLSGLAGTIHTCNYEDGQDCIYCGHYRWNDGGEYLCEACGGCGPDAYDCYEEHHCPVCGACLIDVSAYCVECRVCEDCALLCQECGRCGSCAGEICETCEKCEECAQDTGAHCQECGMCYADDEDGLCPECGRCYECGGECSCGRDHVCLECHEDYACPECGACFLDDEENKCPECGRCYECGGECSEGKSHVCLACHGEYACEGCGFCFIDNEDLRCVICGLCPDCGGSDYCEACKMHEECAMENECHCTECGNCFVEYEPCPGGCGRCGECCGDWCDECGMCVECATERSLHCPDCGACGQETTLCAMCHRCADCGGECSEGLDGCGACLICHLENEQACEVCGRCYVNDDGYCKNCGICRDCCGEWCEECESCVECAVGSGMHCPDCGACGK